MSNIPPYDPGTASTDTVAPPHTNGRGPDAGAAGLHARDAGSDARDDGFLARLRRFQLPRFRSTNGSARAAPHFTDADAAPDADGLHALLKNCEVSFGMDASAVEKRAQALAGAAAAANLPRLDVAYTEVAEEAELAAQCRSIFHDWVERVRTRVQDALQSSTQQAAADLRAMEDHIGGLETTLAELPVRRHELREAQAAADSGQAQLEYRPFISRVHYIVLIGLLVLVDWIANVPVFTELLPKDPGADDAWRELAARSETMGLWGGLYRIFARAAHSIDATLLALGIIIALVWLAHAFGEFFRRWVSHSSAELPTAALTIKGQRRQSLFPALLSFVGIAVLLGVLWTAREQLETTTQNRVAETDARIAAAQERLAVAETQADLQRIGDTQMELDALAVERAQRVERADYARVIGDLNLPIFLLNLVLAVTAAVAAYLGTRGTVSGVVLNPHVAELRNRVSALMLDAGTRRNGIARVDTQLSRHFGRVEYLLRSRPLSGWQAKAQRLESVIPSFRAENARLRGIDVANIAAFRTPARLDLTLDEDRVFLTSAAQLDEYRAQHEQLRTRAADVLTRTDTALNVTTTVSDA